MNDYYILDEDGKTPIRVDVSTFGEWYQNDVSRFVQKTRIKDHEVSSVFLGLDHWGYLWETMVFGESEEYDNFQERYKTRDEMMRRHDEIVAIIKAGKALDND